MAAILFTVASLSAQAAFVTNSQGVIWDIDDTTGNLLGATGINIDLTDDGLANGTDYFLSFEDGTGADLFGANYTTRFGYAYDSFMSEVLAEALANALLTHVLLDETAGGVAYTFDADPELTFGCTTARVCTSRTVVSNDTNTFSYFDTTNRSAELEVRGRADSSSSLIDSNSGFSAAFFSTGDTSQVNYAVWSTSAPLAVSAVPEPETYAMLLAGLALLGGAKPRQQR